MGKLFKVDIETGDVYTSGEYHGSVTVKDPEGNIVYIIEGKFLPVRDPQVVALLERILDKLEEIDGKLEALMS